MSSVNGAADARESATSRRTLLRQGAGWLAAGIAGPYLITSSALGSQEKPPASERLAIGFIGVGGKGMDHVNALRQAPDVQIVAVADVDASHRRRAIEAIGPGVAEFNDYRELLARKDIDAVVISTPDHWHALNAIHACQAGKDVYCEKPLSLTIREARQMANVARACGTVFQVGSQQRSSPEFRKACEYVLSGRIGKLQSIRAGIGGGPTCGWEPKTDPPPELDWNTWLGPARWADYTPSRCHGNFRWFYDYSGGKMTDWGAHHIDIAQWGNGVSESGPVKIEPISVAYPTDGLFETATRFHVRLTYANNVTLDVVDEYFGVHFQGSAGWIKVDRGKFAASHPDIDRTPLGPGEVHLPQSPGHLRDWLNCIKSRRRPIADVEIGCRSATACHLANIALRTGRTITWDPQAERITNDASLNSWLHRPYRTPWTLS
ncbi:MAG TPA: Gfo/Idh/MocA family oxidoreductase [Phycisphaerae bacterium]|nr:Gfo/Idh/MocA family oxidoreductase [Phycisphaerae bacterium]HOJ72630.1 Gfo/Idh/MocA family oxidoreductase [Phycisphaerae bacterium]HOM49709.1 Gfo/Idh/MocA family oxidoreductase [Phycisphaerae bacterium]HOQ85145.1 Gfo/Idh/MocA family oxidoreductase [Phycisphaerae bacterium]HPP25078.1 Gfo/Idh/MocA family oxidoreductase [Phycisphaerae bacterium]